MVKLVSNIVSPTSVFEGEKIFLPSFKMVIFNYRKKSNILNSEKQQIMEQAVNFLSIIRSIPICMR